VDNLRLSSPRSARLVATASAVAHAKPTRAKRLPRSKAGAPVFAPLVHPPPGRRSDLSRLPAWHIALRDTCRAGPGVGRWNRCRPARSRHHAARALDPPWDGWHAPGDTPRRAGPGGSRRGTVARRAVSMPPSARLKEVEWHIAGSIPSVRTRVGGTRSRSAQPTEPKPESGTEAAITTPTIASPANAVTVAHAKPTRAETAASK
jgi:hypothetical protein